MLRHIKRAAAKAAGLTLLFLSAAFMPLTPAVAQALAPLPVVPAQMACTLQAFQGLNLSGVADDNGQVGFSAVSLVAASATNPSAYCSVRGTIGPGANSIVMKLPVATWTQRYVQNGCGGECGSDNLGDLWRVNLRERRATIWMRTVSRRDDHAAVLFVAGVFYGAAWLSPGLGTPTFFGVA